MWLAWRVGDSDLKSELNYFWKRRSFWTGWRFLQNGAGSLNWHFRGCCCPNPKRFPSNCQEWPAYIILHWIWDQWLNIIAFGGRTSLKADFYFSLCSSEVCSSLENWIWRSRVAVWSVHFCSLCVLSRSGLGEQRAGVGWVRGGLAPDLQRFPQLHLLLLDKPQLSQEVPPGASEAGAGALPGPGPLNGRFQGALRVRVCGQQQPDPRALLQRVFHLHPGDADVAEDLLWRVEGMLVTYRSVKAYLEYPAQADSDTLDSTHYWACKQCI